MRLINTSTLQVSEPILTEDLRPYAILSHTWDRDEISFQDLSEPSKASSKQGFAKIENACRIARARGLDYMWIDTCCIDKTSSAELSEAINSMFKYYSNAAVCIVYLSDVSVSVNDEGWEHEFSSSRWFTRGWTLQELIAPRHVEFVDRTWRTIGFKSSFLDALADITGIDEPVLKDAECLVYISVARRMSWAAHRTTTRVEDIAYCLLGIFGVNIPLLYGEGKRAFGRLQEEIMRVMDDASLFAWTSSTNQEYRGLLANFPAEFAHFSNYAYTGPLHIQGQIQLTSSGILIDGTFQVDDSVPGSADLILRLCEEGSTENGAWDLGVRLRQWKRTFLRVSSGRLLFCKRDGSHITSVAKTLTCLRCLTQQKALRVVREMLRESQEASMFDEKPRRNRSLEIAAELPFRLATAVPQNAAHYELSDCPAGNFADRSVAEELNPTREYEDDYDDDLSEADSSEGNLLDLAVAELPPPVLRPDHPLLRHLNGLAQKALTSFLRSVSGGEPRAAATKRQHDELVYRPMSPASRKRLKEDSQHAHIPVSAREDPSDPDTILVHLTRRPRHAFLACPFYVRAPKTNLACLSRFGLRDAHSLRVHIASVHRRPIACPICGAVFGTRLACDAHIRAAACELRVTDWGLEGVTDAQIRQLARCDRIAGRYARTAVASEDEEKEQWLAIWRIVFPRDDPPDTPYLSSRVEPFESVVCMLRGFWAHHGESLVEGYMREAAAAETQRDPSTANNSTTSNANEKDLVALRAAVLQRLIDSLIAEFSEDDEAQTPNKPLGARVMHLLAKFARFASKESVTAI